ncbi:hypothetical protein GUJ93_ZPchr0007g6007 [Zizania palustris]|uniref:BZIP domain-containing protein n=1 Tax=Zizania palustris TaxID=103762 RepID=A0A8J5SJX9_ZIZPA|nr:hypothetical protein GUJ93_ZPchr0007g6007 [Zizania palustris]
MAQLPPKIPVAAAGQQHCWPVAGAAAAWADEFAEFAASRRGAHRRSLSDSVAFVEVAPTGCGGAGGEFDRLDEEQLMSMFPEEGSAPGSDNGGSDSDGGGDQPAAAKSDDGQPDAAAAAPVSPTELIRDPKKAKRILANRQSAQRSRVRKLQYISELERIVTTLQNEVSVLSPRVVFLDQQRTILTVGNSHLKQRIAALAQDRVFKDAHQLALRKEIERLRQVYQQQNGKLSGAQAADLAHGHADGGPPPARAEEELMS